TPPDAGDTKPEFSSETDANSPPPEHGDAVAPPFPPAGEVRGTTYEGDGPPTATSAAGRDTDVPPFALDPPDAGDGKSGAADPLEVAGTTAAIDATVQKTAFVPSAAEPQALPEAVSQAPPFPAEASIAADDTPDGRPSVAPVPTRPDEHELPVPASEPIWSLTAAEDGGTRSAAPPLHGFSPAAPAAGGSPAPRSAGISPALQRLLRQQQTARFYRSADATSESRQVLRLAPDAGGMKRESEPGSARQSDR
ncbi:MAG: hypothetical protein KY476_16930, partial [Planctomycetes bacterium]|nr:hypothetical protein [Planctomycetota bacterium]